MSGKILFVIYSCRKFQKRAEFLYHLLENRLDANKMDLCIIFGKDGESPILTSSNHYILDCGDSYDDLADKTLHLIERFVLFATYYTGIIKCDDDILPNLKYLRKFIDNILTMPNIDYAGRCLNVEEHYSPTVKIPKCSYCAGPMYYLSVRAAQLLIANKTDIVKNYNEDVMVGHNLGILGINPINNPLYCDFFQMFNMFNVQNIKNRVKHIYVRIHGGLGNQLFQCAAAYGIAKKIGAFPILVYANNMAHYNHNQNLFEYINTVFKNMCCFRFDAVTNPKNYICWSEVDPDVPPDACFTYNENMMSALENSNKYAFLNGYFQNERYFKDVKQEFLQYVFDFDKISNVACSNSYFIHVRRGDYVGNQLYNINYNEYLKRAIKHICENDTDPVHFYVISNDIGYCKSHATFQDKTKFTIIDELSAIDTLYFMASCKKGGICANSSFSWWGSYLNSNPEKRVYFPYEWMTNIKGPIDVYPDGAIVVKVSENNSIHTL